MIPGSGIVRDTTTPFHHSPFSCCPEGTPLVMPAGSSANWMAMAFTLVLHPLQVLYGTFVALYTSTSIIQGLDCIHRQVNWCNLTEWKERTGGIKCRYPIPVQKRLSACTCPGGWGVEADYRGKKKSYAYMSAMSIYKIVPYFVHAQRYPFVNSRSIHPEQNLFLAQLSVKSRNVAMIHITVLQDGAIKHNIFKCL